MPCFMSTHHDTIAAIATPPGTGGVGVIRISGSEARVVAAEIWRGKQTLPTLESHRMYYGDIINDGRVLDQALLVWMQAPHSYTGEDVVELQGHGGAILLEQILQCVIRAGARLARPGEFTERAFLNGKLDLAQAEGVADLIHGRSELALDLARDQLTGKLSEKVQQLRQDLVVMRAQLEAMIDYPEDEDVQGLRHDEVAERVGRVMTQIETWLNLYEEGRRRREGVRVALVGRPNVGKSSLLNALLGEDRAIVHDVAGTTRDVVREPLHLGGVLIQFSDTAGLRQDAAVDAVESEGIRRSWQQVEEADLVCAVFDASQELNDADQEIYDAVKAQPHLVVLNKSDLPCCFDPVSLRAQRSNLMNSSEAVGSPRLDEARDDGAVLMVSAKAGTGLDQLKATILEHALPHGRASTEVFLSNLRHKVCLEATQQALQEVKASAQNQAGLELMAADLLVATNHLGEITGEITHEDVMTEVFSRFCLGK